MIWVMQLPMFDIQDSKLERLSGRTNVNENIMFPMGKKYNRERPR